MYRVYLDDERTQPDGYVRVKNYSECIKFLEEHRGEVEILDLDHDLGESKTGYDVCKWLVEQGCWDGLRTVGFHTANSVGLHNMHQLLKRYAPDGITFLRTGFVY